MRVTTWLIVGAITAATAGAITGIAFDTTPIQNHASARGGLPDHSDSVMSRDLASQSATLPDHYALITPEGRIEVEELGTRGRYRDRGFALDDYTDPPLQPGYYSDREYPAEPAPQIQAAEPYPVRPAESPRTTPELAADETAPNSRGGPKVIEFPAGLPSRN